MFFKRILYYINPLNLFKREKVDTNLRFMHGINKISIWLFLFCLVLLLIRWLSK